MTEYQRQYGLGLAFSIVEILEKQGEITVKLLQELICHQCNIVEPDQRKALRMRIYRMLQDLQALKQIRLVVELTSKKTKVYKICLEHSQQNLPSNPQ